MGHTLGGLPVDGNGRCVVGNMVSLVHRPLRCWRCCLYGLHGAAPLAGNRLLDALTSGASCRKHAGEWVADRKFSAAAGLEAAVEDAQADVSAMMESEEATHVVRCGTVMSSLHSALASTSTFSEESMATLPSQD